MSHKEAEAVLENDPVLVPGDMIFVPESFF